MTKTCFFDIFIYKLVIVKKEMNNTYGTVRPSVIDDIQRDIEIWYRYTPKRSNTDDAYKGFKKIPDSDVSTMLEISTIDDSVENVDYGLLPGMYNLKLPASIFSNLGFYTIYIKPKEIICEIKDVGVLTAYPDVRGIIIDTCNLDSSLRSLFKSDNLSGYRVEYFDSDSNGKNVRQEYYRLITSGNLCEPVSQNVTSSNTNSNGYRYNESGTLSFLTLTPSVSPSFIGSQKPFIGTPNQTISITNTKFDPVCVEIELCKNDFDTITTVLTGNQIRDLDNGTLTTYNENGEIFNQYEIFTLKDNFTTKPKYDVKKSREGNIDMSNNYPEIMGVD